MRSPWPHSGLIFLLLLAGCSSSPQATDSSTTDTRLYLRHFEGCKIDFPDKTPIPCGTTIAVQPEAAVPEGWICMATMAAGRGTATIWSDRNQNMGIELDFGDRPLSGLGILDARVMQGNTMTITSAYVQGYAFVRLTQPSTEAGEVMYRVWDFIPAEAYPGFAVGVSRYGVEPWYSYRVNFNGTPHHFEAFMVKDNFDGLETYIPGGSNYTGADFTFNVATQKPMGPANLPFQADWDEPNPILDKLPRECPR